MNPTLPPTDGLPDALVCRNVSFRYGKREAWVIRDFDHQFRPGVAMIKGASGCGKSTLLRLLAGYLSPEQGTITLPNGGDPRNPGFQRQGLGFVFQHLNLLPLASLNRNLELAGSLAGLTPAQVAESSRHWLQRLGLNAFAHRPPSSLSGGQQQRAALARALVRSPSILLLDEPTSGLDDWNARAILHILQEYITGPRLCVICSHDSRLDSLAHEILDFNRFLPVERHLVTLVGATL
jgi:ABC-type lipoprotein export system ATPase subunit